MGPDLGGAFQGVLQKPKVAIFSGEGTSSYGVGEVWHLLNHKMGIPVSLLNAKKLNAAKLSKYVGLQRCISLSSSHMPVAVVLELAPIVVLG